MAFESKDATEKELVGLSIAGDQRFESFTIFILRGEPRLVESLAGIAPLLLERDSEADDGYDEPDEQSRPEGDPHNVPHGQPRPRGRGRRRHRLRRCIGRLRLCIGRVRRRRWRFAHRV